MYYTTHQLDFDDRELLGNTTQMRDYLGVTYKERPTPRRADDASDHQGVKDELHDWFARMIELAQRVQASAQRQAEIDLVRPEVPSENPEPSAPDHPGRMADRGR